MEPIPSEPWPHDMTIRVDVHSHLTTLLFIRAAWGIAPDADVPPLDPAPEIGASAMPSSATREEWGPRWSEQWRIAWEWFDGEDVVGVAVRREITEADVASLLPPRWESEHGQDGVDAEALGRWEASLIDDYSVPLDEHPERRNLDALIPAWRAGVDSIIVLPYRGYFAQRVTRRHLAVSKATRDDPVLYDLALSTVQ